MLAAILVVLIAAPNRPPVEPPRPAAKGLGFKMCPHLKQFPENAEVAKYLAVVVADFEKIRAVLEAHGAWQDEESREWRGVPFTAIKYELLWTENQRIHKAWVKLDYATWENEFVSAERHAEYNADLIDEIGREWFERAIMPTPISLRQTIPAVDHRRFAN